MTRQRKDKVYYDPTRIDSGVLAQTFATHDKYFVEEPAEDSIIKVLENLMAGLPERQRDCVEMCIMKNMTYAEVSRMLGCADQTARRETLRGIAKLKIALENTPWAQNMIFTLPEELITSEPVDFYTILKELGDNEVILDEEDIIALESYENEGDTDEMY